MERRAHPGRVQLLNYIMGLDLDARIRAHIEACPDCQSAIVELGEERARVEGRLAPRQALQALLRRAADTPRRAIWPHWRLVAVGAAALLLVLLGAVGVYFSASSGTSPGQATRIKGRTNVQVYLHRDGQTIEVGEDMRFRSGDRIRIGVSSPVAARVSVFARQADGFVPIPALADLRVPAGEEQILPGSLTLGCETASEALRVRVAPEGSGAPSEQATLVFRCERP
ncbi:MAG: hypothetical protein JXR96_17040 [Deltaproteobacteria bacterium]|nr:hypothetical protein [Deltaproteobacteria bacterium]